ncbi:MAG: T9SS type A sorting domain-containing protein [Chitinophagales bacterium]|nr:T9SS type A sorting domain-containing protein [Chitinophagales bacterium]
MSKAILVLLLALFCIVSESYATADTTLFRIKSLQDTVDAGDTVDVDLFIGDDSHLADSIKEFELEIEYDLDICDKNNITFDLDNPSLTAFFGTSFTDVTNINTLDGHVNIKVDCNTIGSGTARIGRIKYIVQDNLNGRQLLKFDFFKLSAKRLNGGGGGNDKPVKFLKDSVLVIKGYRITAVKNYKNGERVKIYPNPFADYLQIEGEDVQEYQLIAPDGRMISAANNDSPLAGMKINMTNLSAGSYMMLLKVKNEWQSYHVLKE